MNSILLSSGFVIPASEPYVPIKDNISIIESLLSVNRLNYSAIDKQKLIAENVHINPRNNEIYKEYISSKDYESYMAMVDTIFEDLSALPVKVWIKLQLGGTKLSSIAKSHFLEFIEGLVREKGGIKAELYIPFNLRFNPKVSDKNTDIYLQEFDKLLSVENYVYTFPSNWKNFITLLHEKRKLVEFYKLVFVDFY